MNTTLHLPSFPEGPKADMTEEKNRIAQRKDTQIVKKMKKPNFVKKVITAKKRGIPESSVVTAPAVILMPMVVRAS